MRYGGQMDNALKAIRQDDDSLTVGNYIILFGGRDLEGIASDRVNADGSTGEFFTKATRLDSAYTSTGRLYVDWEHGAAPSGEPRRDDVLGYVDWKTAAVDEHGVFVERVLNRRNEYMKWLEGLITEGLIGNSSEAVSTEVQQKANGEITSWPLRRDTLTVTPMEPRMLSENTLAALKALNVAVDLEAEAEDAVVKTASPPATDQGTGGDKKGMESPTNTEVQTMSEKEKDVQAPEPVDVEAIVKAATEKAAADAIKAFQEAQEVLPVVPSIGIVTPGGDEADRALKGNPFETMGEFLVSVAAVAPGSQADPRLLPLRDRHPDLEGGFNMTKALGAKWMGSLYGASMKAPTGLGELVPSAGGFLVDTDRAPGIMARVYEVGSLLQRVAMFPISANANGITFRGEDETSRVDGSRRGGVLAYWAEEAAEKTASTPKFREIELKLRKCIGLCYATDELLADAVALEAYLLKVFPEELRFTVEDSIINGTGAGQPLGILNGGALVTVGAEVGQAATTLVSENIINMWARMYAPSRRNAVWLINQDVEPQMYQFTLAVGTGGSVVYMPPGGLSAAPYGTLFGRPVMPVEYCPTLGTVGDIMLVDLSEYYMIEKGGIQSASSIHVRFVYDEATFRFVYRVDGQPSWSLPLTPFQGTDTQSPFIALESRT